MASANAVPLGGGTPYSDSDLHLATTAVHAQPILGLISAVVGGAITAYFLHFLYQVKRDCAKTNKTARQIAEVLLWFQLVMTGIYAGFNVILLVKR